MKTILLAILNAYRRYISPLYVSCCRFHPSCSAYMTQAVSKHGALKGLYLGLRRILKCHPYSGAKNFLDHVPESFDWPQALGYKQTQSNQNDHKTDKT